MPGRNYEQLETPINGAPPMLQLRRHSTETGMNRRLEWPHSRTRPSYDSNPRRVVHSPHSPERVTKRTHVDTSPKAALSFQRAYFSDLDPVLAIAEHDEEASYFSLARMPILSHRNSDMDKTEEYIYISVGDRGYTPDSPVGLEKSFTDAAQNSTPMRTSPQPLCPSSASPSAPYSYSPTPAWMRPFHLVDDDKTIQKNVHGEDWKTHPLCVIAFVDTGLFIEF
ncbi:hypothetical protein CC78DRAFT_571842 [Lojkania enalia]|uniref:Uncharacterized protein n=1 Tax=Lojkania enalia TaxID=147567 RepID=A0A9P4K130_9PLEO|nr:hypothetical protein CC78DRAFT_571842 [Didymosphaeria enalia]